MKFNLKNRPKTCFEQELCIADGDLAKWFEGFEKELREKLDVYERLFDKKAITSMDTFVHFIREILGES